MKTERIKRSGLAGLAAAGAASLLLAGSAKAGITDVTATPYGGSFESPVHATGAPGFPDLLYVTERGGRVMVVENGVQLAEPFLDLSGIVTAGGEQGLLSIAFPPGFAESGLVYAYFTNKDCNGATGGCDIEVAEFKTRRGDPRIGRESTRRTVITIPHRDAGNHNGGTIAFGPDGRMWLATGDGGGGGDEFDNARRKASLLGKLLRINPMKEGGRDGLGYRIPNANPFVGAPGRDEIWSIGLRNPFRFSFDGSNIAIGDVGQSAREEVSIVPIAEAKGADFGWPAREGTLPFDPARATNLPLIEPIHDYPRPVTPPDSTLRGISVIGGVFVRDPRLAGTTFDPANDRYFFGEAFTQPTTRSFLPNLETNSITGLQGHAFGIGSVAGIGEDSQDRVYIVSLNGTVHRLDPIVTPRQGPPVGDGEGAVDLVEVGGAFESPVNSAFAPGQPNNVYIVEQGGTAEVVVNGETQPGDFLNITDLTESSGEQGFLGMAFHPNFATNGLVYAYYTDEANGDIVVSEFETDTPLDARESSRRQVIRIRHRFADNHYGGQLVFGPDGFMYFATGDGGGGGGGDPQENAQDKGSLLGKLIRINPRRSGGDPYTIPNSNPFVGKAGRNEIYALGLRNPFRFNFEPVSGNIMIGDVGQQQFEEVSIERPSTLAGANFGWDRFEGFERFVDSDGDPTAPTPSARNHDTPVLAYGRNRGRSVIGGLVVRDPGLTNLYGRYLFTDFFAKRLRSFVPKLSRVDSYKQIAPEVSLITSFTEDPITREVYITSLSDGALYRLEPAN